MVNTTAAIMAIPGPMDPIRLVGDEEKHATLLFFGETSSLPEEAKQTLLDAVELASTMLFPFGEAIVDVTRLGSDVPPALVALLAGENLNQVRNLFLMNPAVNDYRGNTDQFPGFTPHVTLSHPDFTDEAIQRALMRQVYRVQFDRLSVWWNDERFDFPLGPVQDNTSMADAVDRFVAQYALEDGDHLEHHGVKGQKWGVSKAGVSGSSRSAQAKIGRAQAKELLVDHAYAKRSAQLAGLSVAGIAAAALAPGVVPAAVIAAAGGATVLSAKIALAATVATRVGYAHNYLTYAKRVKARVGTVAHAAVSENRTVEQVYNDLDPAKKLAANLMIADTSRGIEFADDPEIQNGWSAMTELERSVVLFMASGVPSSDNVAHTDDSVDGVLKGLGIDLKHAVKLGAKKGKPGHVLFIVRGIAPKVGTQFNHQGSPHEVVKVDTSSSDPKRHMITAKKVDAKAVAHADLDEWETYLIEDDEDADYFEHHGIKGMKWGVRRAVDSATGRVEMTGSTGLNPRRGSADQIAQDRIQKKIDTVGVHALSTAELQSYSRRLQMEKDVNRVLAEQSAAQKAASQSFVTNFVKKQAARQTNRVVDKALDVAVEKALHEAGIKIGKKGGNPDAADLLVKTAHRLAPKKGK